MAVVPRDYLRGGNVNGQPHEVFIEGFRSDTYALARYGWEMCIQNEPYNRCVTLALRHPKLNIQMLCNAADYPSRPYHGFEFHARTIHPDIRLQSTVVAIPFIPVTSFNMGRDGELQWTESKLFPDKVTETILVEPSSVTECLDLIRRLQAPVLSDIRKRSLQEGQKMQYHAQILSIA